MSYQTAAGARAAFHAKLQSLEGLEGLVPDDVDPSELSDGIFITTQEGRDVVVDTLIGATRPAYEVYSEVSFDVLTRHSDKEKEALFRRRVVDALETDHTLGGAVDDVQIVAADNDVDPEQGAERSRLTQITIQLHFTSTSPVG